MSRGKFLKKVLRRLGPAHMRLVIRASELLNNKQITEAERDGRWRAAVAEIDVEKECAR